MSTATTEQVTNDTVDIEAILPDPIRLNVNGQPCRVNRLKTREFLSLMRVLTAGLGPALGQVRLDFDNAETIARDMSALMLLAVPNATQEFSVFLASIVEPLDPGEKGAVAKYLHDNPDLDVMIDVFEAMATQEKDDLAHLMGKARSMWSRVSDLYRPKTSPNTSG